MPRYLQRTTLVFLAIFFTFLCQSFLGIRKTTFFTHKISLACFFCGYLHISFFLLIRKLFPTTLTLENAITPAAIMGLNSPSAASGMAATL